MTWKILTAATFAAAMVEPAIAQTIPTGPLPGTVDSTAAARNDRAQVEGYNRIVNEGVKVSSPGDRRAAKRKNGPILATPADFVPGAAVRDKNGVQVATIKELDEDGAVVSADNRLTKLPINSFGKDSAGLMIGISADEFRAAIANTSVPAVQESKIVDATAADMTPGTVIRDSEGVPIGTVEKVLDTGVVVVTDGKKVKMALNSFAKDEKGLMIGITASELKAAINK